MTGFSGPIAGGGLGALSGGLPASALMQLLARTGASGLPGSLAPQIPTLPGAPRGAAGPVAPIPPVPQPLQNNMLGSLGGLAGLGKMLGGGQAGAMPGGAAPWSWQASTGLFGGNGPLFGVGAPFTTGGIFGSTPAAWGTLDPWSALGPSQLGALNAGTGIGFDTGAGALGAGAAGVAGAGATAAAAAPAVDPLAAFIGFSMGGV